MDDAGDGVPGAAEAPPVLRQAQGLGPALERDGRLDGHDARHDPPELPQAHLQQLDLRGRAAPAARGRGGSSQAAAAALPPR